MADLNEIITLSQRCQSLKELINADPTILEAQNNQFIKQFQEIKQYIKIPSIEWNKRLTKESYHNLIHFFPQKISLLKEGINEIQKEINTHKPSELLPTIIMELKKINKLCQDQEEKITNPSLLKYNIDANLWPLYKDFTASIEYNKELRGVAFMSFRTSFLLCYAIKNNLNYYQYAQLEDYETLNHALKTSELLKTKFAKKRNDTQDTEIIIAMAMSKKTLNSFDKRDLEELFASAKQQFLLYAINENQNVPPNFAKYYRLFLAIKAIQKRYNELVASTEKLLPEKELSLDEECLIQYIMSPKIHDAEKSELLDCHDKLREMFIENISNITIEEELNRFKYSQFLEACATIQKKWNWWMHLTMEEIDHEHARIRKKI